MNKIILMLTPKIISPATLTSALLLPVYSIATTPLNNSGN